MPKSSIKPMAKHSFDPRLHMHVRIFNVFDIYNG